jgi:acetolactate synthase-1/2/3 large subunit
VSAPTRPQSEPQAPASKSASQDAARIASDAAKPAAKPPTARPKHVAPEQLTGAQSVIRSLEELDVEVIFGIPGGAVLPVYDPLFDSKKLRHVLVRHEQGAGHAASGYAHATGKVGVMMATSGPGATNLVTPLADAQMDSIPVVAVTGQVGRALIGTDAFQEADISGITMPITKHNFLVRDGDEIPRVMAEAFHIAASGRPGAVLVDIPKDVLQAPCTFSWPPRMDLPGYKPNTKPHSRQINEAAKLIAAAHKPVLYVGGGVIRGEATEQLRELAELTGIPVVTTLMARGAFPDSHRQHLGMPGMHGTVSAVAGLQRSDLLIALGTRFDDRVTGQLDSFAPEAKVIHADIDPAEIGKNRHADVPIVGDVKAVITELIAALRHHRDSGTAETSDIADWWTYLNEVKATYPLSYGPQSDGSLSPEYVIEKLGEIAGPDAVYVAVHLLRKAANLAQLRRFGHHGLRHPGSHGRQDGPARRRGLGDRRRRLLPDDQPGTGHLRDRGRTDQGGVDQQRQPRHGAPVADPVLRGALLADRPSHPLTPDPRLRQAGRGAGLCRIALRA